MQSPGDSSDLGVSGAWLSSHWATSSWATLWETLLQYNGLGDQTKCISSQPPSFPPPSPKDSQVFLSPSGQDYRLIQPMTIIWQALACGITLTNKKTPLVFGEHIVLWLVFACSTPNHKVSMFFSFLMNQTVCWLYLYLELPKQSCNISGVASGDEDGRNIGSQGHW